MAELNKPMNLNTLLTSGVNKQLVKTLRLTLLYGHCAVENCRHYYEETEAGFSGFCPEHGQVEHPNFIEIICFLSELTAASLKDVGADYIEYNGQNFEVTPNLLSPLQLLPAILGYQKYVSGLLKLEAEACGWFQIREANQFYWPDTLTKNRIFIPNDPDLISGSLPLKALLSAGLSQYIATPAQENDHILRFSDIDKMVTTSDVFVNNQIIAKISAANAPVTTFKKGLTL